MTPKANKPQGKPGRGRREASIGRAGGGRPLHPDPDQTVVALVRVCPHCRLEVTPESQNLHALYDRIEVPPVRPIVTRARFLCAETVKETVNEGLALDLDEFPAAGDFLCYTVATPKCVEDGFLPPDRTIDVEDQFGRRQVQVGRPRLVCAPAVKLLPPPE